MAAKKSAGNVPQNNIVTLGLVGLLMAASFYIGMLYTKVSFYEDGGTVASAKNANSANEAQAPSAGLDLEAAAKTADVKEKDLVSCMEDGNGADAVKEDVATAKRARVTGTPGNIFVNVNTGKNVLISGAMPFEGLKPTVDALLSGDNAAVDAAAADLNTTYGGGREIAILDFDIELPTESDHVKGDRNAAVALIEYSDYECPFCARFHPTGQQIVDDYNGQVQWIFRHFPLDQIHPNAREMAEVSECLAQLGGDDAFWAYTDGLYQ